MTKAAKIFITVYLVLLAILLGGVSWLLICDLA